MEKIKSIRDISWKVDEVTYRKDSALSYSILSKYERTGFSGISNLFTPVETPSTLLGQAVDSIITGGEEEFESRFLVADFPSISDSIISIVKELFDRCNTTNKALESIKDDFIIQIASKYNYQNNWKPETRAKVIKEKGSEYYSLLYVAGDKIILNTDTYNTVLAMVDALKNSEATKYYFANDNPFEPEIERVYQAKFKATFDGVDYRCMADLLLVNHKDKIIYPVDLKTSYKFEYDFYKSFVDWRYDIQGRLYWRIIKDNLERDEYFKDFKLDYYRFIVVSRDLHPLVWVYYDTKDMGNLNYGKLKNLRFRDPFYIGEELKYILDTHPIYPSGIKPKGDNDIVEWLEMTY